MSNPFDDLKAEDDDTTDESSSSTETGKEDATTQVTTDAADNPDSVAEHDSSRSRNEPSSASETSPEQSQPSTDESVSPAESGPAFEYSDVQQKPFYARTETVTQFENKIRTTIVPTLAEAEVLDEETREIHDAVLRLANEHPERIAELVLEERRQTSD